jgi:hypothetical protein
MKKSSLQSTNPAVSEAVMLQQRDVETNEQLAIMPSLSGELNHWLSFTSLWMPQHVVPSAWHEHGPFAFWLIQAARPAKLVELGTHQGYSYLAFCQAIQRLGLDTTCYAVDTWQGDEHAGFYGEEVFTALQRYHNEHYSAFSQLIRTTFDDAASYFPDGSIDLLHIDGRHSYEDVKHDFTTWASKLSDRAIVLFHDVNVRERNFGVWKFWQELRRRHPSFEFEHGHGLGVLAYGENIPAAVKPLVAATAKTGSHIRAVYARLGAAVTDRHALSLGRQERAGLTQILKARDAEVAAARDQIGALDAALQAARQENAQQAALRTALEMHVQEDLMVIKARDAELAAARGQINTLNGQLQAAHQENQRQAASHNALDATFQKQLQVTKARDTELAAALDQIKARDADLAAALDQIDELQAAGEEAASQAAALQEELKTMRKSRDEEIGKLQRKLAEPAAVESTKMRIIQQQMRMVARLNQEIIALKHQAEPFQNLLQSTSWRVTAPLRAAKIQWNRLKGFR